MRRTPELSRVGGGAKEDAGSNDELGELSGGISSSLTTDANRRAGRSDGTGGTEGKHLKGSRMPLRAIRG